jgi:unsaturated rhamnogalacturonyl hydrolase
MRLAKTHARAPGAIISLLLSTSLWNCSSNGPLNYVGPTGGTSSAGAAETIAGTAGMTGSAAATTGGSSSIGGGGAGGAPIAGSGGTSAGAGAGGGGSGGAAQGGSGTCPIINEFATWPTSKAPLDIGKLAVDNFKGHTGDAFGGAGYAWTFAYVGSLQFTKLTADTATNTSLITGFERYASGSTPAPNNAAPPDATVDDRAFGDLPLEIFIENQDERSKKLGLDRADAQWSVTTADGITRDARYWADDMFMITGLQVYAYRATKDKKYLERAAKAMLAYLTTLQQPDGHFWHTRQSKAYWGRANGWIAAGMAELLLELPAGTDRDGVMAGYKKQMDGLLAVQIASGNETGLWRQVLDVGTAEPESSCTAMFTFALITGIRNGWLTDAKYVTAARNGWLALGNKTNASGVLDRVCPGTGQAASGSLASQQKFYTDIKLGSNDQHGQAPLLWAAIALLRPDCPGAR